VTYAHTHLESQRILQRPASFRKYTSLTCAAALTARIAGSESLDFNFARYVCQAKFCLEA